MDGPDILATLTERGGDISALAALAASDERHVLSEKLKMLGFTTLGARKRVEQALKAAAASQAQQAEDGNELPVLEDNVSTAAPSTFLQPSAQPSAHDEPSSPAFCKEAGNRAFAQGDLAAAIRHYNHALTLLDDGDDATQRSAQLRRVLWANLTQCHLEREEWWEACFAAHRACDGHASECTDQRIVKARLRYAVATMALGLLSVALDLLASVTRDATPGGALAAAATERAAEASRRSAALATADRDAVEMETAKLRAALGADVADSECAYMARECATPEGCARLLSKGFLEPTDMLGTADMGTAGMGTAGMGTAGNGGCSGDHASTAANAATADANDAATTATAAAAADADVAITDATTASPCRPHGHPTASATDAANGHGTCTRSRADRLSRACHRALLYQTKKHLQRGASRAVSTQPNGSAAATTGGSYHCLPVAQIARLAHFSPSRPVISLTSAHLECLERERLVVIDGALPASLIAKARDDVHHMCYERKVLRSDPDDLCNPLQRSMSLPLHTEAYRDALRYYHPHLDLVCRSLWSLPAQLQRATPRELRVPQTFLVAAYPPGACYREHLDAYVGEHDRLTDIPRYLVGVAEALEAKTCPPSAALEP